MSRDTLNPENFRDPMRDSSDDANFDLVKMKYADREKLSEAWAEKRKLAAMNEKKDDGTPNPHYPRLSMEADIARMAYDMAYMVESNRILEQQVFILSGLFERVGLLEGAYAHLRQSTDYVKNQYKDSMRRHHEERKEFNTLTAMQRVGLDPDSKEDRLKWAQKLDEVTAHTFKNLIETKEQKK